MRGIVELNINRTDIANAERIAGTRNRKQRRRGLHRNIPNVTERVAKDKNTLGALGEVLFAKYYQLRVDESETVGGDRCDFIMGGKMIDVKTSQYNNVDELSLFVRLRSLSNLKTYCLVWVNSARTHAHIRGYATGATVRERGKLGSDKWGHEFYRMPDSGLIRPRLLIPDY